MRVPELIELIELIELHELSGRARELVIPSKYFFSNSFGSLISFLIFLHIPDRVH